MLDWEGWLYILCQPRGVIRTLMLRAVINP
jgi:hypothetical protein